MSTRVWLDLRYLPYDAYLEGLDVNGAVGHVEVMPEGLSVSQAIDWARSRSPHVYVQSNAWHGYRSLTAACEFDFPQVDPVVLTTVEGVPPLGM